MFVNEEISNFIIHILGTVSPLYLIAKETCEAPAGMVILFVGVISYFDEQLFECKRPNAIGEGTCMLI